MRIIVHTRLLVSVYTADTVSLLSISKIHIHKTHNMPASSRKRNKGKDRKAKQLAKKEQNERVEARKFWLSFCGGRNQCNHGCDLISVSDDHPVTSFIDQFYINLQIKDMSVQQTLKELFFTHRHIWDNESYRKLSIGILTRIGTNMMLREGSDMSGPGCVAQAIVVLEHYNDSDDIVLVMYKRAVLSSWKDVSIISSERRDTLKFLRKRTTCKCLKKMHLEARKTIPKKGLCWNCKEEKDRMLLSVCSKCMVIQYCSRECQVAAWPGHKEFCGLIQP